MPLYYERDRHGVPLRWIRMAKEAIRTVSPEFNACRMMNEYTKKMYIPAVKSQSSDQFESKDVRKG